MNDCEMNTGSQFQTITEENGTCNEAMATTENMEAAENMDVNPEPAQVSMEQMGVLEKAAERSEGGHPKEKPRKNEQPLVVDMSSISTGMEEMESLSNFQHIATGFFAQTKEPALTISGKTVTVNSAAARLFPDVDYMEILINPEDRKVAYQPCDALNIHGYKWAREKDGKRYATQRTGLPFVLCVCQIMGWDPGKRYRILGKKVPSDTGEEILLFDLKVGQGFEKREPGEKGRGRSTILTGWDGTFGPAYNEKERSLHMDTFDGYTIFSIKDGWSEGTSDPQAAGQTQVNQPGTGVEA